MYYEINVSLNGKHFFATAERSVTNQYDLDTVYKVMKEKFPECEGYEIGVTEYQTVGKILNMVKNFSLAELQEMPTIEGGQFDNLKYEDSNTRILLSRMTKADGAPYDNQVTVYKKIGSRWSKYSQYQAL